MIFQILNVKDSFLEAISRSSKNVARPILHVLIFELPKHVSIVAKVPQKVVLNNRKIEMTKCGLLVRRYIKLEVCRRVTPKNKGPSGSPMHSRTLAAALVSHECRSHVLPKALITSALRLKFIVLGCQMKTMEDYC